MSLEGDAGITVTKPKRRSILDRGSIAVGFGSTYGVSINSVDSGGGRGGGGGGGGGRGGGIFAGEKKIRTDMEGTFILPKIVKTSKDLSRMPKTHNLAPGSSSRKKFPLI